VRTDIAGLTTPMLFSNQALELNQTRTKILINAYIDTLSYVTVQPWPGHSSC
jgi:hypothetical protein